MQPEASFMEIIQSHTKWVNNVANQSKHVQVPHLISNANSLFKVVMFVSGLISEEAPVAWPASIRDPTTSIRGEVE